MQRQNNITYQTGTFEGSGLNELSDNNTSTNNLVNSLKSLVDSGGFEASSLENDAAATTDTAATPAATPAATTAATTPATTSAATTVDTAATVTPTTANAETPAVTGTDGEDETRRMAA
jgi:peptidoglycan hydrolase CwlO-like protein